MRPPIASCVSSRIALLVVVVHYFVVGVVVGLTAGAALLGAAGLGVGIKSRAALGVGLLIPR